MLMVTLVPLSLSLSLCLAKIIYYIKCGLLSPSFHVFTVEKKKRKASTNRQHSLDGFFPFIPRCGL
jgi:hypothetical protein